MFDKLPTIEFIKNNGCNSIGLIHLIRLKNNKNISGHNNLEIKKYNYVGSLGLWFKVLKHNLIPYCIDNIYEIGTLLIKKTNQLSHGHIAIIIGHNKILHSYTNNNVPNDKFNNPGICISNISHFSFDFVCQPSVWLYTDF